MKFSAVIIYERKKPNMEMLKENIRLNTAVAAAATQRLVEGDVIVPDTKPDILKVLQVDAVSCITDKEVSDGLLRLCGRVDFKILYIPDSERRCVKSIGASFDFEEEIANKDIIASDTAMTECGVERAEFSLLNSRKLRLKAAVSFDYEIIRVTPVDIAVDIEADASGAGEKACPAPEIKRRTVTLKNSTGMGEFVFPVRGRAALRSGQSSFGEILKADYSVTDTEYKAMAGRVAAKGTVTVCILYTDADGETDHCECELPFTEVWDIEEMTEDSVCDIGYRLEEGGVTIEEDVDGDLREAAVSVTVTAQLKAAETLELDMIEDCYIPYKETRLETERAEITECAASPAMQNTIRESIELPEGAPEIASVYNVIAKPHITKVGREGRKLLCEGRLETCVLYISESAESPVCSIKKNIPFSYALECSGGNVNSEPKLKAEIKHIGYSLNSAGEAELRCILAINAELERRQTIELITDVQQCGEAAGRESRIVVYFVRGGDTLWDIAKHYGVPCGAIIEFNELDDDTLKTGMRLLIPGK